MGGVLHIPQFSPTLQPPMANNLFSSLTIQPCDLKKLKQLSRCRSHLIWWSMTPWANRNFNLWTAGHWSGSWIWSTGFLKCSIYIYTYIIYTYIYIRGVYIFCIFLTKRTCESVSTKAQDSPKWSWPFILRKPAGFSRHESMQQFLDHH